MGWWRWRDGDDWGGARQGDGQGPKGKSQGPKDLGEQLVMTFKIFENGPICWGNGVK